MTTIDELRKLKAELIQEIDQRIEALIAGIEPTKLNDAVFQDLQKNDFEAYYPLCQDSGFFKGKKPTGVILPNNNRVNCSTWKMVVYEIISETCMDPEVKEAMKALCGKVAGKKRKIIDINDKKMRSPLEIDKDLFIETHYDTETLLNILKFRILDPLNCDYSNIQIAVRL